MLFHAKLPRFLWVEALLTAVFLINRLPSQAIQMESPFDRLFQTHPDYSVLKVFGCRCFPYLRDRASSKFEPKSYPCVFIGYSTIHKGFRCYHPPSRKVFLSRHVVFDEHVFPYADPLALCLVLHRGTILSPHMRSLISGKILRKMIHRLFRGNKPALWTGYLHSRRHPMAYVLAWWIRLYPLYAMQCRMLTFLASSP